jgi:Ribonuclease G/E
LAPQEPEPESVVPRRSHRRARSLIAGATKRDQKDRPRPPPPAPVTSFMEVIKRRQIMLVQVVKEERGNKGAR